MELRRGYVYGITNIVTGQWYVGKTINKRGLLSRWQNHVYTLRKGEHRNRYLQNSWNKYGEKSFMFVELFSTQMPLEELKEFIYEKEKELTIEKDAEISKGGFTIIVGNGEGRKYPEYIRVKIAKSQKGVPKPHMRGENHPNFGKGYLWKGKRNHTEETKKRLSELHTGKKLSNETRKKLSIAKKGKPIEKTRGENHYKSIPIVQLDKNNNLINKYSSSMEAYRETGIHFTNINRVCRGERKSAKGFKWMYEKDYKEEEIENNGESKKNII